MNFSLDTQQKDLFFEAMFKELAVIIFNTKREVIFANANMAKVLGYGQEEIIGLLHREFCFDEYANSPAYQEFWESLIISKKSFQDKIIRKNKQGEQLILEGVYFPILDKQNQVVNIIKIAFDITKRETALSSTIKKVRDSSDSLTNISTDADEKITTLSHTLNSVDELSASNQAATKILEENIQQIAVILTSINSVAYQTKLLSFNASLEAARVGDKAAGFNVVVSEMQKLAEQTKALTLDIDNQIQSITQQTTKVLASSTSTNDQINDSKNNLSDLQISYKELVKTANLLNEEAVALMKEN